MSVRTLGPASLLALLALAVSAASAQPGEPEATGDLQTRCVGKGVRVGDRVKFVGEPSQFVVRRVLPVAGTCHGGFNNSAVVERLDGATGNVRPTFARPQPVPPAPAAAAAPPVPPPARAVAVSAPSAPPAAQRSVVERLRELKQLREENLITAEQYEAKQKEILSAQ